MTVTERADVTDLVELATVKARLGVTGSAEDALLSGLIEDASSKIVSYLGGFDLARQTYTETARGYDRTRLPLSRWPVDSDSVSVTVGGDTETEFTVESPDVGVLWLEDGWEDDDEELIAVSYKAGYLIPQTTTAKGNLTTWASATAYVAGAWVRPSTPSLSPYYMECTTAGTSGGTEPTWPDAGSAVTDNSAVWTARKAWELPKAIRNAAWLGVQQERARLVRADPSLSRWTDGSLSESYFESAVSAELPPSVTRALDRWRLL